MVQALPQYTEQVEKISLHVEVIKFSVLFPVSFICFLYSYPTRVFGCSLRIMTMECKRTEIAYFLRSRAHLRHTQRAVILTFKLIRVTTQQKKYISILTILFKTDSWKDQQNYQRNRSTRAWAVGARSCFWGCWSQGSYYVFKNKAGLVLKTYVRIGNIIYFNIFIKNCVPCTEYNS